MGEPGHVLPDGKFGCYLTDRCFSHYFTCVQEEDHEWGNLAMSYLMESLSVTLLTGVSAIILLCTGGRQGNRPCLT